MGRLEILIFVALAAVGIGGLTIRIPSRQLVEIVLTDGSVPRVRQPFKFISKPTNEGCGADGLVGMTDDVGHYTGTRSLSHSVLSLFTIDVSKDRMCLPTASGWEVVWQLPYGPTRPTLLLTCDLGKVPNPSVPRTPGSLRAVCSISERTYR